MTTGACATTRPLRADWSFKAVGTWRDSVEFMESPIVNADAREFSSGWEKRCGLPVKGSSGY